MRLIRLKEVLHLTGLARSSLYRLVSANNFPAPVSLGDRAVAWIESEIQDWVLFRIEQRNNGKAVPNLVKLK